MNKRKFSMLILLFVLMFTFVGCNKQNANEENQAVEIPNEVLNMELVQYQNEVTNEEFLNKLKKYSDGFKESDYISNEYKVSTQKATAKEHQSISGVYEEKQIGHGIYKIDHDSKIETFSGNMEFKTTVNSTYKNTEDTFKGRVEQVYQKKPDTNEYVTCDCIGKKLYDAKSFYDGREDFFEFEINDNAKYYVDGNVFTTITVVEGPGYKRKIKQKIYNDNEFILLEKFEYNQETLSNSYFEDIIMSDYIEKDFSKKIIKFENQKLKPVDITGYTKGY